MYTLTDQEVNDILWDVDTTNVSNMVREIYRIGFMAGAKDSVFEPNTDFIAERGYN